MIESKLFLNKQKYILLIKYSKKLTLKKTIVVYYIPLSNEKIFKYKNIFGIKKKQGHYDKFSFFPYTKNIEIFSFTRKKIHFKKNLLSVIKKKDFFIEMAIFGWF